MADASSLSPPQTARRAAPPPPPRKRLPSDRSLDQLWNHFQVEKALAERLRNADRASRRAIYDTMYDELFERVRDHPRLTRPHDSGRTERTCREKARLIGHLLRPDMVIAEIAPGDCVFLGRIASRVGLAYGIDISDQRPSGARSPSNLQLIVYDGYDTQAIPDASLDLVFSDQLIEHLHPEDTADHFRFVRRLLKPGGRYVFRTPHALTGPHDVSAYFSDVPLGFHLKEWTYRELDELLASVGLRAERRYWALGSRRAALPGEYFRACESSLGRLRKRWGRPIARALVPTIEMEAVKI